MARIGETNGQHDGDGDWNDFVHTGPGTLAGRYLRMFWQPVHRAEDIAPGRAKLLKIMSEDFTLYRGETGLAHAVAFRCAHRGTQLSTGWVEGENLRCFYHGWVYGPDGQCIEQPAEPEPFCSRIRIRAYPTQEYLGLIFVFFGEGDPPPLPRFPDLEDESQGVRENYTYTWPCNYFNSLENDPYHGLWVHRESYEAAGRAAAGIPEITCEETDYGYVTWSRRAGGRATAGHRIMPNSSYGRRTSTSRDATGGGSPGFENSWRGAAAWRVPVDDEHFVTYGVNLTHLDPEAAEQYREVARQVAERAKDLVSAEELGERVLRGEIRIEDVEDRHVDSSRLFNLQDYASQVAQGAIADRAHEHLGREDATILLNRMIWRRELRALAEGRPLKQWALPDQFSVGMTRGW
jgi:5,5'-dehydrodivanillate O-demethylase